MPGGERKFAPGILSRFLLLSIGYLIVVKARSIHGASLSLRRCRIEDTYEVLCCLQRCKASKYLANCLLDHFGKFGITHLLAGAIPPPQASCRAQLSHVLLDAWPARWSQRYFASGYLYRDPTIQLVGRGIGPFLWCDIDRHCHIGAKGRVVMDEATEFGLREGLTLSFSTLERRPVGFSLAGERLELDPGQELSIQLVAAFALGCAAVLAGQAEEPQDVSLSQRQQDVIQWIADGLTVNETAKRLRISSHTADTHLRIARQKLGVTSSVHAVAEAFRRGLIR